MLHPLNLLSQQMPSSHTQWSQQESEEPRFFLHHFLLTSRQWPSPLSVTSLFLLSPFLPELLQWHGSWDTLPLQERPSSSPRSTEFFPLHLHILAGSLPYISKPSAGLMCPFWTRPWTPWVGTICLDCCLPRDQELHWSQAHILLI